MLGYCHLIRAGCIGFLAIVAWSCVPTTYTYYPAQRRLKKKIDLSDSFYIMYPYAKFSLIGEKDEVLGTHSKRAHGLAIISSDHLVRYCMEKIKFTGLVLPSQQRDSLISQFLNMNKFFYEHKRNNYSFKFHSNKRGYGLIYGVDWQLRDYKYWISRNSHNARANRILVFSYWCLFDLRTGEVVDYKFNFLGRIGGWGKWLRILTGCKYRILI